MAKIATRQEPLYLLARLRRWRHARFLTQQQLADGAKVSRVTIMRIERGEMAKLATVKRLAEALETTPTQLCNEEPDRAVAS